MGKIKTIDLREPEFKLFFKDLKFGDAFSLGLTSHVFVKTDIFKYHYAGIYGEMNCFNLSVLKGSFIDPDISVVKLDVELHVKMDKNKV